LHEKSLKRATFTCFSIKNRIKTQTLHENQTTNKKKIILHEKSLKRATFTCFSIKNCIKAQALHANHSTNTKRNILLHENHLKEQPLHVFPT